MEGRCVQLRTITKIVVFSTLLILLISSFSSSAMVYDPPDLLQPYFCNYAGISFHRSYYRTDMIETIFPAYDWQMEPYVYGTVDQTFRYNSTYNGSSFQQVCAFRDWNDDEDYDNPFSFNANYIIGGFNDTLSTSNHNTLTITGDDIYTSFDDNAYWTYPFALSINNVENAIDECTYTVTASYTVIDTVNDIGAFKTFTYTDSGRVFADESDTIYLEALPAIGSMDGLDQYSDSPCKLSYTITLDIYTDYSGQKFNISIPCVFTTQQRTTASEFLQYWNDNAYSMVYDTGYDTGYREGFYDGSAEGFDFVNFLKVTVGSFFQLQIMPNVTIGLIFSVIFIIILLMVFLHKFGGR